MSGRGKNVAYLLEREEGKPDRWVRHPPLEEGEEDECYWEDGVPYHYLGGMREMTRREKIEYNSQIRLSEVRGISKIIMTDVFRGLLDEMAKLALVEYNNRQATQLVLKHVQKANQEVCCDGLKYYITFDVVAPDNRIQVFQAQVVMLTQGAGYRVNQVRPKPTYC